MTRTEHHDPYINEIKEKWTNGKDSFVALIFYSHVFSTKFRSFMANDPFWKGCDL